MKYFDHVLKQLSVLKNAVSGLRREVMAAKKAVKSDLKAPKAKPAKAKATKAKPVKAPKAKPPKTGKRGGLVRGTPEWKAAEAARIRAWRAKKKAETAEKVKVPRVAPKPVVADPEPTAPVVSPLDFSKASVLRPSAKPVVADRVTLLVSGIEYEHDVEDDVPDDLPDSLSVIVDAQTAAEALDPDGGDFTNLLLHIESLLDDKGIDTLKHRPTGLDNVERATA